DRLTATKKVLSQAGPLRLDAASALPLRDEVGTLLIDDIAAQRRRKIQHERDLGVPNNGFGTLPGAAPPADSDKDGMPDTWENATGSDSRRQDHNEPSSRGGFLPVGTGYTRLEEYLHFLAIPHCFVKPGETVGIDLNRYASGFRKPLVWSATRPGAGTLALDPSGTARFTAPADGSGRSGFNFTVTDADGSTWTQPFALLIAR
ncbi:MAG: hypothetical protein KDN05_05195, partial [Verrucomicrobiae bacterium]|nr:hypothetical protein [Verrucomicrobiae bacterium]